MLPSLLWKVSDLMAIIKMQLMAIIKMQSVKAGKPYGLKAVLDYIQNPDKTENGRLISAKDCLLESAYQQMHLVKQEYQQMKGRQYVHIIQSMK